MGEGGGGGEGREERKSRTREPFFLETRGGGGGGGGEKNIYFENKQRRKRNLHKKNVPPGFRIAWSYRLPSSGGGEADLLLFLLRARAAERNARTDPRRRTLCVRSLSLLAAGNDGRIPGEGGGDFGMRGRGGEGGEREENVVVPKHVPTTHSDLVNINICIKCLYSYTCVFF